MSTILLKEAIWQPTIITSFEKVANKIIYLNNKIIIFIRLMKGYLNEKSQW